MAHSTGTGARSRSDRQDDEVRRSGPRASKRLGRWIAVAAAVLVVGAAYRWIVRSPGYDFEWGRDLGGYYDYLGRAFARGQLHVPIEPAPELLALPDPWDPKADDTHKMHDMVLYRNRYYLYHGAGPALILFAPWRLATGHDLPERFALLLLCFGGFLFSCGALLRLLDLAGAKPGPPLLALMLLGLGICQCIPYLLSRVWVYEIAIGGGYFCLSGALFFFARGVDSRRSAWWFAAAGLFAGLAVTCRPHLGLAAACMLAGLAVIPSRCRKRDTIAFLIPLALAGAALAAYNFARFGNPFEFGLRYILAGEHQNRIRLAWKNVPPGLYFLLFCAPDFSPVFPWVRLVMRYPFNSLSYSFPPGYVIEKIAGALYLAPFVVAVVLIPKAGGPVRILLRVALASSAAVLLFLAGTGWSTQRYEVDFLPWAVLAALAGMGIRIARSTALRRGLLAATLTVSILCGVVVNLALGISGPYDEMANRRTGNYLRIARWFSPVERFRPLRNPRLEVEFTAGFRPQYEGFREPLLTIGHLSYRHFVYAEHLPGKLRIVSRSDASTLSWEMEEPGQASVAFRVTYSPQSGRVATSIGGKEVLLHDIGTLLTAPAQVTVGENRIDDFVCARSFTGALRDVRISVAPGN